MKEFQRTLFLTPAPQAMKLGGNTRDVDSFVDQLESEGVKVVATNVPAKTGGGLSKVRRNIFSILLYFKLRGLGIS